MLFLTKFPCADKVLWNDVYYWRTSTVTVSDDLGVTSTKISGADFNILVQNQSRSFSRGDNDITLKSGWTIVIYVMNPDSIG